MSRTAATFCATLVDEWVRAGVTAAFAAPGSRSTPLALALQADRRLRLSVFHDERAAAFAALGHSLANGIPAVVTCTSGTAAAHLHAAVIEADLSSVPLIVCTTDRPPELWQVGAPQTIEQTGLFGNAVRFFAEPGVPSEEMSGAWRSFGSRLVAEAAGGSANPGPVHVNLSFRDPLVAETGPLPPGRPNGAPWHDDLRAAQRRPATDIQISEVWNRVRGLSGVIVAGWGTTDAASVLALGRKLGWPVLADHRSGCRAEGQAIAHFDQLLRSSSFASDARPDVVLRFGQPLASKVLSQWIASTDAEVIAATGRTGWTDPERVASVVVDEPGLARGLMARIDGDYRPSTDGERWTRADTAAAKTIDEALAAANRLTEPQVARSVVAAVPSGGSLVVASSMPVRDVEWFGGSRRDIRVYANRGANGIDGLIATAAGIALTGSPTTLLIGDVAFLHDSTALIGLRERAIDLTIVVIDNDGGGIFSFLPQAEQVPADRFEQLFGTPHGTDLATLCLAHGIPCEPWPGDLDQLAANDRGSAGGDGATGDKASGTSSDGGGDPVVVGGPRVIIATTDRHENVQVHEWLNESVVRAVGW